MLFASTSRRSETRRGEATPAPPWRGLANLLSPPPQSAARAFPRLRPPFLRAQRVARGESRHPVRLLVSLPLSLSLCFRLPRAFRNRAVFDIDARPPGRVSLRFSPDRRIYRAFAGVICGVARCASCSRFNTTSVCARSACSMHYEGPHANCVAILPAEWSREGEESVRCWTES